MVSKRRMFFILKVKQSKIITLLSLFGPKEEGIMILRNAGNYVPNVTA
jgi:hypothetical protein